MMSRSHDQKLDLIKIIDTNKLNTNFKNKETLNNSKPVINKSNFEMYCDTKMSRTKYKKWNALEIEPYSEVE